jgi:hypothetical protein
LPFRLCDQSLDGDSENALRFRLDLRPKHWMQAGAGHDIGFRPEDIADAILDIDQFYQTETWIIGIEEEVDIAARSGLPPGNRAEQLQPSTPTR